MIAFRPDVSRWGYPGEFLLRRCTGCGLVFNSPRLVAEELNRLYGPDYYFFDRSARSEVARIQHAYLRTVAHLPISEGRLLEIGSAKGYLLALLARLGWQVTGVELSESAAAFARRRFGVEVFAGTLETFRRHDGRCFDVVLAQDLVEHVPEQEVFWRTLGEMVPPGSWLIIDTPNVGGRNVEVLRDRWRGFNPFHIYLFDSETLRRTVTGAGFDIRILGSYNDVPPECSVHGTTGEKAESWIGRLSPVTKQRLEAGIRPVRRARDRMLLPFYFREALGRLARLGPVPLSPDCGGDNLVCIAVRSV